MELSPADKLKKVIIVGDRVLIKPTQQNEKSSSGLYLPPGVKEKEKVQKGYVMKTGPGYAIPLPTEKEEPWQTEEEKVKYVPLQAQQGDLALFLVNAATEIRYENDKYYIVPHQAILLLERDEEV